MTLLCLVLVGSGAVIGASAMHLQRTINPIRPQSWVQISLPSTVTHTTTHGAGWICSNPINVTINVTGVPGRKDVTCFYFTPWFRGIGRDRRGYASATIYLYGSGCERANPELVSSPLDIPPGEAVRPSTLLPKGRCTFELTIPL